MPQPRWSNRTILQKTRAAPLATHRSAHTEDCTRACTQQGQRIVGTWGRRRRQGRHELRGHTSHARTPPWPGSHTVHSLETHARTKHSGFAGGVTALLKVHGVQGRHGQHAGVERLNCGVSAGRRSVGAGASHVKQPMLRTARESLWRQRTWLEKAGGTRGRTQTCEFACVLR